jgi:PAS domain S-box-containing protein
LDDQALLTVIAQQAALFLESARGYAQLQRRVEASTAELRAANRELATEKTKLEALVDEMESGVVATDSAGRVVTWNRAAARFLGVSEEDAFGRAISTVLKDQRLLAALSAPEALKPGGLTEELEVGADGQRYVLRAFVTAVAESEGDVGTLALLTDITQLKELDRMKTDLISFVSHELKNPLASIKGFAQLLRRGTDQESPNAHLVAMVNQQANRMQWIVEDFLDMTRLDAGIALQLDCRQMEDVGALARGICDLQALTAPEHAFRVEVKPDPLSMTADRGKVEQVLVNLISNAVKYSPDGGAITVSISAGEGETMFRVADEGLGITTDQKANLFRRFERILGARERIKGTGIGLFLSRYLVEAHGGQIWVQNNEPRGSVFGFTIPDGCPDREETTGAEAASSP